MKWWQFTIAVIVLFLFLKSVEGYTGQQLESTNYPMLDSLYVTPDRSPKAEIFQFASPSTWTPKILSYANLG